MRIPPAMIFNMVKNGMMNPPKPTNPGKLSAPVALPGKAGAPTTATAAKLTYKPPVAKPAA